MKGVKIVAPRTVEVWEWPDVPLGPHDVRVRIKASALCRSDLSLYYMDEMNPTVGALPAGSVIPGHEPAGVIEEIGSAVTNFKIGDRVAVQCFAGCGHCRYCKDGWPNLCDTFCCLGFDRHGGHAETLVTPEITCLHIPDEMSFKTASVATDAVGNLYNTMKTIGVSGARRVAVIGVGPMGLAGVLVGKAMGAEVIAIDLVQSRLDSALELGADYAYLSQNAAEEIDKLTKGRGVECVVDCSGKTPGITLGFDILAKFGSFGQVGVGDIAHVGLMDRLVGKMANYVGSWYFQMGEWEEICDFIVNKIGNSNCEKLVSHEYPLETAAVQEAWELFDQYKTDKVIFVP